MNLSVGAYRTDEGKPYVLNVVHRAEKKIANSKSLNKEYLPISGNQKFIEAAQRMIFGENHPVIKEKRIAGVQSISGTGALRILADFIKQQLPNATVYLSDPTWGNHKKIFRDAGVPWKTYRYYKASTRSLDIQGLLEDLRTMPRKSIVLFHPCAHNPTGVDPTPAQWKEIAKVCHQNSLLPFFDSAYQGYASGSLERDAFSIRYFGSQGFSMLVSQSFSKNLGLYGERAGTASVVVANPKQVSAVTSQLKGVVRPMYSNPPRHGAQIVLNVLTDPQERAAWQEELKGMSNRILEMRSLLKKELIQLGTPGNWDHITDQIGMFSYTGLTKAQVMEIRRKWHVYMLSSGRISVAGLNHKNCSYLAKAMDDVVRRV